MCHHVDSHPKGNPFCIISPPRRAELEWLLCGLLSHWTRTSPGLITRWKNEAAMGTTFGRLGMTKGTDSIWIPSPLCHYLFIFVKPHSDPYPMFHWQLTMISWSTYTGLVWTECLYVRKGSAPTPPRKPLPNTGSLPRKCHCTFQIKLHHTSNSSCWGLSSQLLAMESWSFSLEIAFLYFRKNGAYIPTAVNVNIVSPGFHRINI